MPLTKPSFLPVRLVPFVEVREKIGSEILGSALSGRQLVAIYYDPGGNFLPLLANFWQGPHGAVIMDHGYIPSAVAWQIGIPNGGEDISIYLDALQAEAIERVSAAAKQATSPTGEADRPKSMRDRDIEEAIAALEAETLTKRLTRAQASEFLRQRFPSRHITEADFRSIFKKVPTAIGRPRNVDKKL
ncbi:hypothetical protein MKK69_25080 [Methylobacterium sp. J-026]|uniref:hypothetical protein n=1 Tax=Methylobacterium sp. J-026 TaxID=2836624 RepID=UPI001FBBDA73|nr:hypothetical protein [Methylobacterium sp. J-026]MCJ2137279.1 hypothetical protein [Methylobacterium sp. J-026]